MGGGGGESVERGHVLLARQNRLGGRQRLGHLPRFLGDPLSVKSKEDGPRNQRRPDAENICQRKNQGFAGIPGQGQMKHGEGSDADSGQQPQKHGMAHRLLRRRDRHGRNDQEGKGILQTAREIKKRRDLQHIVSQHGRSIVAPEPQAARIAYTQKNIEPRRERDDGDAQADRQIEAQSEIHQCDGSRLTEHRNPAQPDYGPEPQQAGIPAGCHGEDRAQCGVHFNGSYFAGSHGIPAAPAPPYPIKPRVRAKHGCAGACERRTGRTIRRLQTFARRVDARGQVGLHRRARLMAIANRLNKVEQAQ
ncbi:hypothetical protein BMS3Bbin10_01541 [bacterium BMS3Bbin10]|nr:hypothetical protein BMS3Bbin10_01541 [bacterium BMS3Bbin10]